MRVLLQAVVNVALVSALSCALPSCGSDAERRYAGLSEHIVESADANYRVRYLAPPWKVIGSDTLVTGARKSVPVGQALRDVVAGSASVLVIPRQSNLSGPNELSFAKYRLEVVALRCSDQELSAGSSCAQWLADSDYAGRLEQGERDETHDGPRADSNDSDQRFYELSTFSTQSSRHRRIVYFELADPQLALRLYFDANPDLSDAEVTNMVRAFEVLRPSADAGSLGSTNEGGT